MRKNTTKQEESQDICSNLDKFKSKTGLTDSGLLGYRGWCYCCGGEKRLYYMQCRDDVRAKMYRGFKKFKGTCDNCLIRHKVTETIVEWAVMSCKQVDKDLYILGSGIDIDFEQADTDAKYYKKMDKELEDYEKRVEDYNNKKTRTFR